MLHYFKRLFIISAVIHLAFLCADVSAAQETIRSEHFNIYLSEGVDKIGLLRKLKAEYFLRMRAAYPESRAGEGAQEELLGRALDAIYMETSDILDIHMYSFKVNIEVLADMDSLSSVLEPYFNKKVRTPSFYFLDKNRIYISYNDITLGMLSHEIAHAIVSHYFVVPPPQRLQEILSGYVEYTIRKQVNDLP